MKTRDIYYGVKNEKKNQKNTNQNFETSKTEIKYLDNYLKAGKYLV